MNALSLSRLLGLLAAANFVIGMGAFVVIGVLSPLAAALHISKAEAGWLMTVYAIVYAISSPLLVALTGRQARERVLLAGLALFGGGALLAFAAPNLPLLLLARALMAVGGGLVTPVAASVGVAAAPPEQRGRALATVFGGLTLAQVLGVPVGAWLGYRFGWPAAFAVVAMLAGLCALLLARALPRGVQVPPTSLATLAQVLATPRLLLALAFTSLFVGGLYTLYTFLAPLIEQRLGLGRDGVTALLLLFGAGAVLGNALGGWLSDRLGPTRSLLLLASTQLLLMPLLSQWASGLLVFAPLLALWSVFAWSFMVPQQARLVQLDAARTPVLFALNAAALYLGSSLGSLLGGWVLAGHGGFPALGCAGALMMLGALVSLAAVARLQPPLTQPAPAA